MSLNSVLDRIREAPDTNMTPGVASVIATRLEEALASPRREDLGEASRALESIVRDLLVAAPSEVRVAALGQPNPDRASTWALTLGQLSFAQMMMSQAYHQRADDAFVPTLTSPEYKDIIDALKTGPKTPLTIKGKIGENHDKMMNLVRLGIVDSRSDGRFYEYFLTPPALRALETLTDA